MKLRFMMTGEKSAVAGGGMESKSRVKLQSRGVIMREITGKMRRKYEVMSGFLSDAVLVMNMSNRKQT